MCAKIINIHDVDYLSRMHVAKMNRFVVKRPHMAVEELASQTTNRCFLLTGQVKKNMGT